MPDSSSSSFLESMTFASASAGAEEHEFWRCDCDECDISVPPPIRDAIRQRKRQRLESGPMRRTQDRSIVCRHTTRSDKNISIAVWKWTMPVDAEPLIEFGSSHRVVWIQKLPSAGTGDSNHGTANSTLRSIGRGIIGSSDEERSRTDLIDWGEGSVVLVPSNGGKAVGWIHTATENTVDAGTEAQNAATGRGPPAVLYVAKIPVDPPVDGNGDGVSPKHGSGGSSPDCSMDEPNWVKQLLQHCRMGLEALRLSELGEHLTEPSSSLSSQSYYVFPKEAAQALKTALREASLDGPQDASHSAAKTITSGKKADNGSDNKPKVPKPVDGAVTMGS